MGIYIFPCFDLFLKERGEGFGWNPSQPPIFNLPIWGNLEGKGFYIIKFFHFALNIFNCWVTYQKKKKTVEFNKEGYIFPFLYILQSNKKRGNFYVLPFSPYLNIRTREGISTLVRRSIYPPLLHSLNIV